MSFLSRKPARPDSRDDGDAGRDDEYDDYDLYAADRYQGQGDDAWSPGEYFSPEGIKGRWAGENPEGRSGGRGGRRDNGRGEGPAGYDGYPDGFENSRTESPRRDTGRGAPARDDSPRAAGSSTGGYPAYGADEYASGAYDLPEGADEDRPAPSRRRRRDRDDRSERTGILRLRRDRGEDIWPDDGISDEDYWASVAADRPLTEPGAPGGDDRANGGPGHRAAPRPGGPDSRFGPGPGDRDPRGPGQRGSDQRGSDQRGAAGRLGPPPGLAGDHQAAAARPGTGPNAIRPGTGSSPTVGVTVSRPPAGPGSTRSGSSGGPGTGSHAAWPGQPAQTQGRASGGFPQASARPSFQPASHQSSAGGTGARPAPDRGDWGERTERIERVNAAGYPDPRPSTRSQGPGQTTGHNPVVGAGSGSSARPPAPPVPVAPASPGATGSSGAAGRGHGGGPGRGDSGFWPASARREADRRDSSRDGGRDSGREAGGSIWSVPPDNASARGGDDDPLTSTAYSRSALGETDGRSYRVAARRSQAQAMLTDQTESFAAAQYQQGQYQAGRTGDYPAAASFPPADQRTGEHRQYRGDGAAGSAQEATVRYPAYGSQQGHQPQHSRGQSAGPGQPATGQPTVSQPSLSQPGFGPGNGQNYPGRGPGGRQQSPPRSGQAPAGAVPLSAPVPSSGQGISGGAGAPAGSRPGSPGGPNPYDSGGTGAYPYPGGQAYTARPAPDSPPPNGADDRYYRTQPAAGYQGDAAADQGRPEQPRPDQGRPARVPGYANGSQDRRERPY
jgi:hypothetical protein